MTVAPKFSMTTSVTAARRRNTSRPSSVPISIATPSMPREKEAYIGVLLAPDGSVASVGASLKGCVRTFDGRDRDSIFTTSAPRAATICAV